MKDGTQMLLTLLRDRYRELSADECAEIRSFLLNYPYEGTPREESSEELSANCA
jgi:hypothetical protein